jgi:hypothetical protein
VGYVRQIKDFIPYLVSSLVACLPVYFVCQYVDLSPIISIIVGFAIACSIYFYLMRKDDLFKELLGVLLQYFKKNKK